MKETLGKVIRRERLAREWSLRDLAKTIGVHYSYVCDLELDRRCPSERVLQKLCKELVIDFDQCLALCGRTPAGFSVLLEEDPDLGRLIRMLLIVGPGDQMTGLLDHLENEVNAYLRGKA